MSDNEKVWRDEITGSITYISEGTMYSGTRVTLTPGTEFKLREYFLAERDKELGRWRDPVEKNATVYRMGACLGSRRIMISNELNGASEEVLEIGVDECLTDWSKGIAERYFAAHPIKKPWHTPKHLEIWALTIQGCPSEAYIYRQGFAHRKAAFRPVNHEERVEIEPTDPLIVDAHRIWPES